MSPGLDPERTFERT